MGRAQARRDHAKETADTKEKGGMKNMKKDDCESAIRSLCHRWRSESGQAVRPAEQLSFIAFKNWLAQKGYSHYLSFRTTTSPDYDAELWFDQEFGQVGRR